MNTGAGTTTAINFYSGAEPNPFIRPSDNKYYNDSMNIGPQF